MFRNQPRTDLLCQLIRSALNKHGNLRHYATAIREHVTANGGPTGHQLSIVDPRGHCSLHT